MSQSTTAESFESWEKFLEAYYSPIRTALSLLPFVGECKADDLAQSFFLKMFERDILEKRFTITGRFRNWLYVAARHHALDEWRRVQRRPEHLSVPSPQDHPGRRPADSEDAAFDSDEFYALSVLHLAVRRVRKHLIEEGKTEHWMIFEELVLAPLFPARIPKTREELLAMFPGQGAGFLDNRLTTVKRVFRRILPAMIPADPTERLTAEERFSELLEILWTSKNNRLWLAFLTNPMVGPEESSGSSRRANSHCSN
jgi:DNA-directed RNA polymerase specialized sigma24 family protein